MSIMAFNSNIVSRDAISVMNKDLKELRDKMGGLVQVDYCHRNGGTEREELVVYADKNDEKEAQEYVGEGHNFQKSGNIHELVCIAEKIIDGVEKQLEKEASSSEGIKEVTAEAVGKGVGAESEEAGLMDDAVDDAVEKAGIVTETTEELIDKMGSDVVWAKKTGEEILQMMMSVRVNANTKVKDKAEFYLVKDKIPLLDASKMLSISTERIIGANDYTVMRPLQKFDIGLCENELKIIHERAKKVIESGVRQNDRENIPIDEAIVCVIEEARSRAELAKNQKAGDPNFILDKEKGLVEIVPEAFKKMLSELVEYPKATFIDRVKKFERTCGISIMKNNAGRYELNVKIGSSQRRIYAFYIDAVNKIRNNPAYGGIQADSTDNDSTADIATESSAA